MLTLRGQVVTAGAMHCQRQAAQQVVEQVGDYALALKGNRGTLHDGVQLSLDVSGRPGHARSAGMIVRTSPGHHPPVLELSCG